MFSVTYIKREVVKHLKENIPQQVVEMSWRDFEQMRLDSGKIPHYVSVEFGDVQQYGQRNMASTYNDNHTLPVSFLAIGPTPKSVSDLQDKVLGTMIAFSCDYAGEARKRAGGMMFPLVASNEAVEGYCAPISFSIPIQLADI